MFIVGHFAGVIVVVNEHYQARFFVFGGVFQHIQIAVGIAGGNYRTPADVQVDVRYFGSFIVVALEFRQLF